jgi:tetratricopeptide (TPR) repeat protein
MVAFLQRNSEQGILNWTETQETAQCLRRTVEKDAKENPQHLFERQHFTGRMLLSEYADYRGWYKESEEILAPYASHGDQTVQQLLRDEPKLHARFALQNCRVEYRRHNFKGALSLAEEARKINEKHGVGLGKGLAYFYRASVHYRLWNLDQAEQDIQQAIRFFHQRNRQHLTQHHGYQIDLSKILLARIIRRAGAPHERVLLFLDEAQSGLDHTQDYVSQARLWQVRGRVARTQGDPEKAEESFSEALSLYKRADHRAGCALVNIHLGHLYTRMGGAETNAESRIKHYEHAEQCLQEALRITHPDRRASVDTSHRFAHLYLQWGETERDGAKLQQAASRAQDTIKKAQEINSRFLEASARVVLAYVQLFARAYGVAGSVITEQSVEELVARAETLNHDQQTERILSHATQVGCWLLKALYHCWSDSPNKLIANQYLVQAREALAKRSNEYLSARAEKVAQEIAKLSGDFHISQDDHTKSLSQLLEALTYWRVVTVVKQMRAEKKFNKRGDIDRNEAAKRLGLTRPTLERIVHDWEKNNNRNADLAGIPPEDRQGLFDKLFGKDGEKSRKMPPASSNDNVRRDASSGGLWGEP